MRKPFTVLDSIVRESMRLQPAMPSGVERMTPPRGLDIAGTFIPGNTICRVPNYVTFRDQRYFAQPNDFMPERWTTGKDLVLDGSIFRPFGQGRYSCVGSRLAMMKIRTVLAYLVTDFEFLLADKTSAERWERSGREHFLMAHRALNLRFEKRA
jgi:cytochrome P450